MKSISYRARQFAFRQALLISVSLLATSLGISGAVAQTSPDGAAAQTSPDGAAASNDLETVVVTGTSIRGVTPTGSSLITMDPGDIANKDPVNNADLLSAVPLLNSFNIIPENQGGTKSRSTGYLPNIHDLGYYATLTIFNGHRLAPEGGQGTFADPNIIPTNAIDRVEIIPDGASGVYGSDAVAGVVNLIYRKNVDDVETNFTYGSGIGSYRTFDAGILAGTTWSGGSVMFAYQFSDRVPPTAGQVGTNLNNQTPYGGSNFQTAANCVPGYVTVSGKSYQLPGFTTPAPAKCNSYANAVLFPEGQRHAALVTGDLQVNDKLDLWLEVNAHIYRDRSLGGEISIPVTVPNTNPYFQLPPGVTATSETVTAASTQMFPALYARQQQADGAVTLGANYKLFGDWLATGFLTYSQDQGVNATPTLDTTAAANLALNTTTATAFNPFGTAAQNNSAVLSQINDGFLSGTSVFTNELAEGSLKADGTAFGMWGGDAKAAVGVDWRFEGANHIQSYGVPVSPGSWIGSNVTFDNDITRNVFAAYAELHLPIVGPGNAMPLVQSLEVALDGRYDYYTDAGGASNPKIGIQWQPVNDITVHTSAGTSFVAPNLGQEAEGLFITPQLNSSSAVPFGYPVETFMNIGGGNTKLYPEEAKTFSSGVDYHPSWLSGLTLGMNYFYVHYKNFQFQSTAASDEYNNPELNAYYIAHGFPGFVINPSPTLVAQLESQYKFQSAVPPGTVFGGINTSPVINLGKRDVEGIDYSGTYNLGTDFGQFTASYGGTEMLLYTTQELPGDPYTSLLGTDTAIDFIWRATLDWKYEAYGANIAWNHTGPYMNIGTNPFAHVDAFDTVDLRVSYQIPSMGSELSVRAQNLLDTKAPFYNIAAGYDSTAASPLGRIIEISLRSAF